MILAKTIKGWTLGPDVEGRNATHQIKKMTREQLRTLRDRLYLQEEVPDDALDSDVLFDIALDRARPAVCGA